MADRQRAEAIKNQYGVKAVYHVMDQPNGVKRAIREECGEETVNAIRDALYKAGMIARTPRRLIGKSEGGRPFYEESRYKLSLAGTNWMHRLQAELQTSDG